MFAKTSGEVASVLLFQASLSRKLRKPSPPESRKLNCDKKTGLLKLNLVFLPCFKTQMQFSG
jgi:hypothetical protein